VRFARKRGKDLAILCGKSKTGVAKLSESLFRLEEVKGDNNGKGGRQLAPIGVISNSENNYATFLFLTSRAALFTSRAERPVISKISEIL